MMVVVVVMVVMLVILVIVVMVLASMGWTVALCMPTDGHGVEDGSHGCIKSQHCGSYGGDWQQLGGEAKVVVLM